MKAGETESEAKYTLTFQATGCLNGNLDPNEDPITYWKDVSQSTAFNDMFAYCTLVRDNKASSIQIERCCGTSACTPNDCIKQTEWTLGTVMAYNFAILTLY